MKFQLVLLINVNMWGEVNMNLFKVYLYRDKYVSEFKPRSNIYSIN